MGKNDTDDDSIIDEERRGWQTLNILLLITVLVAITAVYFYHTGRYPFVVHILMIVIVVLLIVLLFHSAIHTIEYNKLLKNRKKKKKGMRDYDTDYGIKMPHRPNRGKHRSGLPDFNIGIADSRVGDEEGIPEELVKAMDSDFTGYRSLLVDDNEISREIAKLNLEKLGFEVEIATHGKEAVDMIKGSDPGYYDVVLMDIQMPVMNGYEATRKIRKLRNKKLSQIPVVAVTMCITNEDIKAADKAGMNGHIAKPIDISKMKKVLEKALEKDYNS